MDGHDGRRALGLRGPVVALSAGRALVLTRRVIETEERFLRAMPIGVCEVAQPEARRREETMIETAFLLVRGDFGATTSSMITRASQT